MSPSGPHNSRTGRQRAAPHNSTRGPVVSSFNQITLLGNVGSDPDVRDVGGSKVASFSLATSRKWTGKDGTKQEKTEWHRCQVWNAGTSKLADIVAQYVRKGAKLLVVGAMEYREWEKDGVKRTSAEVRVSSLQMVGGKSDDAPKPPRDVTDVLADEEDDLPFN